jgi:peroxiredoxin 2/4
MEITSHSSPLELYKLVPDFELESTHGFIRLSQWQRASWVLLFSHPADFTPVCTSEFIALARAHDQFTARNVALLGLSTDSVFSHIAWVRHIRDTQQVEIPFPILADTDQQLCIRWGMLAKPTRQTRPVRATFLIDPSRRLRATLTYPAEVGRSIPELLRLIDAVQLNDASPDLVCPADWTPGQPCLQDAPSTLADADARTSHAWYLTLQEQQ